MSAYTIDLNCDLGEGEDSQSFERDRGLMQVISSCNIACGFHAGSPSTMAETVRKAIDSGVRIGAHPSYDDRAGFGRRDIVLADGELRELILSQIDSLQIIVSAAGGVLTHVKPHGALYNHLAYDYAQALVVAKAVREMDPYLILYVFSGSESYRAALKAGARVAREAFIDRAYLSSGRLMPRSQDGALFTDAEVMAERAIRLVKHGRLEASDGTEIELQCETLCIHGDHPGSLRTARVVAEKFKQNGIAVGFGT